MLSNFFKIAFRNLFRYKAFSFINIVGLAIGMAGGILILFWVQDELSFDRFHEKADQIYRLTDNAGDFQAAVSPVGMGAGLQSQMPDILRVFRMSKPASTLINIGDKQFQENNTFYIDSTFFDVFSFPLLKGNPHTALSSPNNVLITASIAKKYFGNANPLGQILKKDNTSNLVVAGVLADPPSNSHWQFDILMPMSAIENVDIDLIQNSWINFNYYTYILFNKKALTSPAQVTAWANQIQAIVKKRLPEQQIDFHLQPLTSIHLHSNLQIDLPGQGNVQYVKIFFVVAFFILLVACINFMNLSTARSGKRAKEVGLRKTVGASRKQLIFQFMGESLLITFIAFLLSLLLLWLLLPAFNTLSEKKFTLHLFNGPLLAELIGIALITGLVSGIYPALYLSGFKPIKVLKGKLHTISGNLVFRNALVVTQFFVSIVLLVGTYVVYNQLRYIRNKDLGFDKENLIYVPMTGDIWGKQQALKDLLAQNPLTSQYTIVSDIPTELTTGTMDVHWEGKDPNSNVVVPSIDVDEDFVDVFHMKILNGRSFSKDFKADSSDFVVNEQAVKLMGIPPATAVGRTMSFGSRKGTIIGVIKDFNFKSIQHSIEPLVLRKNRWGGNTFIRTQPGRTEETIRAMTKIYHQLNPAYPMNYYFLDQDLARLYKSEQKMGSIFNVFVILAIFISCLGLYGLSAFIAEQRTKEIGVRKVLGASIFNIVYLLSGSFTRLILIAMAFSIPISWYAVNSWLSSFAYHIQVSWTVFFIASLMALLIAWATVSYESVKAAIVNPTKSLRAN